MMRNGMGPRGTNSIIQNRRVPGILLIRIDSDRLLSFARAAIGQLLPGS